MKRKEREKSWSRQQEPVQWLHVSIPLLNHSFGDADNELYFIIFPGLLSAPYLHLF